VSVGTWQLSIALPAKYSIADVLVGRKPIESNELEMLPGQHFDITLVASSQPAVLRGTALGSDGQPLAGAMVFLRAADRSVAGRFFGGGATRTGPSGGFAFKSLPPGLYKVATSFDVQNPDEVDWSDPSLLSIELEEGKEVRLDLKMRGQE
jgi:protocatechuate 3,4-dioxygenase beta subunit